jgi:hypothetical protein
MDQSLFIPFIKGLPLRGQTLLPGEPDGNIRLPVVVTHPDVTDPTTVAKLTPQWWTLDTSFDGAATVDPVELLRAFQLVARPDNGSKTTPDSQKLPFYETAKFYTAGVEASSRIHLFGANLWLVHEGEAHFLTQTNRLCIQERHYRPLLGHRAVLKSGLILEVDYDPFSPSLTVWKMRDVL